MKSDLLELLRKSETYCSKIFVSIFIKESFESLSFLFQNSREKRKENRNRHLIIKEVLDKWDTAQQSPSPTEDSPVENSKIDIGIQVDVPKG